MSRYDYIIADLRISSDRDIAKLGVRSFAPFAATPASDRADCTIQFVEHIDPESFGCRRELSQSYILEADADSSFYAVDNGYLYIIRRRIEGAKSYYFHIDTTTKAITTDMVPTTNIGISVLRFGIWVMFGVILSENNAIAIHSSTIVTNGKGVLFLGESGTGKSTHTRLWRENISGATLLNDDSPILRVVDGCVRVYGSPWSGKTPCYKSEFYPVAGVCRLAQAPYNRIQRLSPLMAIGALLPSAPPIFAHDEHLQDLICSTLGDIVGRVGVYRLECLPNKEAAELSYNTIIQQ